MTRGHGLRLASALVLAATAACAGAPVARSVNPAAEPGRTVWDGVYSEDQAARGATEYARSCSSCHADDLRGDGNAPSLIGVSFLFLWEDRPLDELFTTIRTQMPTNAPNSLTTQGYLDVLAYLMEANDFPAGVSELRAERASLARILVTARPGARRPMATAGPRGPRPTR